MNDCRSRDGTKLSVTGDWSAGASTVIAHRGFAGVNPENTVAAARAAARTADAIEFDVVPCADGTPVVVHDDHLEGDGRPLTDASGVVWETPREGVLAADVLGSGETVPTLAAFADAVPADVALNVELKHCGTPEFEPTLGLAAGARTVARERWAPFVSRVLDTLDGRGNDVLFSSFAEGALAAVDAMSDEDLGVLFYESPEDALAVADRYEAAAVHPPVAAVAGTPLTDESLVGDVDVVAGAHATGREVNIWTVETWFEAAQLAAVGADGLICDYPGLLDGGAGA